MLRQGCSGELHPPLNEALLQNIAHPTLFNLEHFYRAAINRSPYPPDTPTNDSSFEEVEEDARKIYAEISVPLESTHPLNVRWYSLCI